MIPDGYRLVAAFPVTHVPTPNSPHEWMTVWEFTRDKFYTDYTTGIVESTNPYDFEDLTAFPRRFLKLNEAIQHAKANIGW